MINRILLVNIFDFENKKLNAFWYSPPNEKYPRVFISELRIDEGPTTKRFQPKARGRMYRILKRTSHIFSACDHSEQKMIAFLTR